MLEDFRQHFGTRSDGDTGQFLLQDRLHAAFIGAVHERVHEAHGHRRDIAPAQDARRLPRPGLVQRRHDAPGGIHALTHRQPVAARDVGARHVLVRVPEIFLVGTTDFDHVAESLGADHGGARQPARDQRIGRDRGAVGKERHLGEVDAFLLQPRK